jgi:hypothetical protein
MPAVIWSSQFRFFGSVTVTISAGPVQQIDMLRDFLTVLAFFTPLSLFALTFYFSIRTPVVWPSPITLGLVAFVIFLAEVVTIFSLLMAAQFAGVYSPLWVFPILLGVLIEGSAFSVLSLAAALPVSSAS